MDVSLPLLLLSLALGAPGDIYRCADASGKLSFQDRPCVQGSSTQLARHGEDPATSERELRQWLDHYRLKQPHSGGQGNVDQSNPAPRDRYPTDAGVVTEAQLAMCSERFLDCAHGDAAAMDACVDQLPRCSAAGGAPCCPQACVSRYQALRSDGQELATSVRLALLDPAAPACGSGAALR